MLHGSARYVAFFALLCSLLLASDVGAAACINKFVTRTERSQQIVTLLTGKLTYEEAQALAQKIRDGQAPRVEWVGADGKTIAKQVGDLRVVRPMPVGCDGKSSGVVVVATFLSVHAPSKKMHVKLDAQTTVAFDEQA